MIEDKWEKDQVFPDPLGEKPDQPPDEPYEEILEPHYHEPDLTQDTDATTDKDDPGIGDPGMDPEEEWFWKEPENFWLDQDIWPWPPARSKRSPKPENPLK